MMSDLIRNSLNPHMDKYIFTPTLEKLSRLCPRLIFLLSQTFKKRKKILMDADCNLYYIVQSVFSQTFESFHRKNKNLL